MIIEYYDQRFGDTYVVETDGQTCSRITRYVDRIGFDPIHYDSLSDVPTRARTEIERLIYDKCHSKPPSTTQK